MKKPIARYKLKSDSYNVIVDATCVHNREGRGEGVVVETSTSRHTVGQVKDTFAPFDNEEIWEKMYDIIPKFKHHFNEGVITWSTDESIATVKAFNDECCSVVLSHFFTIADWKEFSEQVAQVMTKLGYEE